MFCRHTFEVWQPLKQTVSPKVSCLYVFEQLVKLIFHFSQLSGIFLAQKQRTCLQNILLSENKSSLQQPPTSYDWQQNMSCFHPIRTFFFHVYTRRFNWRYHHCHCHPHPHHHHCHDHLLIYCSLITSSLLRSRSCLSHVMPPPIPPPPPPPLPTWGREGELAWLRAEWLRRRLHH